MRCIGEVQTIARCAGKLGKELVAEESPKPTSSEMEAGAKEWEQDRFPEGAHRVNPLRRERRVAEPFGAFPQLPGGFEYMLPPGGASRPWSRLARIPLL
jgi:hypothetical protein